MSGKVLKTVKKTAKEIVTNKYVLYTVLCLAILNVLAFLATNNFISLAIFALIGVLASYFTKNMTVILLITLVASSFIHISKTTVEAMTNKKKKKSKKESMENNLDHAAPVDSDSDDEAEELSDDEDHDHDHDHKHHMEDAPVKKHNKSKLNHQETVQESYNNIHSILGNKNFKRMTADTNKLLEQQNKLTESLNTMAPILKSAESMLGQFDMEKMTGMLDSLNLGAGAGKKKKN